MNRKKMTVVERFEEKYMPITETGCWIWVANTHRSGYGMFYTTGATMNLLKETRDILQVEGHAPSDIVWIGTEKWGWFTWEEFSSVANVEYHDGYGSACVPMGLLVVGEDWWLERGEYDGSEWWEYKTLPKKPEHHKKPSVIVGRLCPDMDELNKEQL